MLFNNYFILLFMIGFFLSCGESKKRDVLPVNHKTETKEPKIHKISSDEIHVDLAQEIATINQTNQAVPKVKFVASPEMAELFDYLEMDIEQLAQFEVHYQYHTTKVEEEHTHLLNQAEMQHIIDEIFKTILDPEQLIAYKEWKEN